MGCVRDLGERVYVIHVLPITGFSVCSHGNMAYNKVDLRVKYGT